MTSIYQSAAPPLAASMTSVLGSVKRSGGRHAVPGLVELKAAFGELKLDLRDAELPAHVRLVSESLCASVEVLLPAGVVVVDESGAFLSSHKVTQAPAAEAPIVHVEGWSVCSDVKFISAAF